MTPTPTDRERARELEESMSLAKGGIFAAERVVMIEAALAQAREEGRTAGLEEAAAACSRLYNDHRHAGTTYYTALEARGISLVEAAIRALASAPPSETKP